MGFRDAHIIDRADLRFEVFGHVVDEDVAVDVCKVNECFGVIYCQLVGAFMPTQTVNLDKVEKQLADLLVIVETGNEIVIAQNGKPIARLAYRWRQHSYGSCYALQPGSWRVSPHVLQGGGENSF